MTTPRVPSAEELAQEIVERIRQHPGGVDAQASATLCASCVPGVAEDLRARDNALLEAAAKVVEGFMDVDSSGRMAAEIRALKKDP